MKKLLSLSLSLLLLLGIFCACNKKETEKDEEDNSVKTIEAAQAALEKKNYLVDPQEGEYWARNFTGWTGGFLAIQKDGLEESDLNDMDGDGFVSAQNVLYAFYFEDVESAEGNEEAAKHIFNLLRDNLKSYEKDDGVKGPYTLIMERVENVIFIGSEAAIKIAK